MKRFAIATFALLTMFVFLVDIAEAGRRQRRRNNHCGCGGNSMHGGSAMYGGNAWQSPVQKHDYQAPVQKYDDQAPVQKYDDQSPIQKPNYGPSNYGPSNPPPPPMNEPPAA